MSEKDGELLLAWRDGDRRAGGELITRHSAALHRFFFNKVGTGSEVEELIQRTFVACVEGVDRFRGEASFRTWMFAIANNQLRKWILERHKSPDALESCSAEDLGVGPSSALAIKAEQKLLLAGLRRIPMQSQVMLELCYWEGMTAAQIAAVICVPEGTARSRLRKAKLDLRAAIDTLARTRAELESTVERLEDWAHSLREALV